MTIRFEGYEWKKVKSTDIEINIPENNYFYQSYNGRVVTGIFPQHLDSGLLFEVQIIQIEGDQIVKTGFSTDPYMLADLELKLSVGNKSYVDRVKDSVFIYLRDHYGEGQVDQGFFEFAFNKWSVNIDSLLK